MVIEILLGIGAVMLADELTPRCKECARKIEGKAIVGKKGEYCSKKCKRKKEGGCFITTAVCQSFGKADDCYELNIFRGYRDKWLKAQQDGNDLIQEYYEIAPRITKAIDEKPDKQLIYVDIWKKHLQPCLEAIELDQNDLCRERYVAMVRELAVKYY